jgi:hypothetical protein
VRGFVVVYRSSILELSAPLSQLRFTVHGLVMRFLRALAQHRSRSCHIRCAIRRRRRQASQTMPTIEHELR